MIDDEILFDDYYDNTQNSANSSQASNSVISITGEWHCDRNIAPQAFYGEYYNEEITKTNVVLRVAYIFGSDGTFTKTTEIVNLSEVRKEFRSLMVDGARQKFASQGKFLTTDDVLYYEAYADDVLEDIREEQSGTYNTENNRIYYNVNGTDFFETYTVSENELTLTGSSQENSGYPITLTKAD